MYCSVIGSSPRMSVAILSVLSFSFVNSSFLQIFSNPQFKHWCPLADLANSISVLTCQSLGHSKVSSRFYIMAICNTVLRSLVHCSTGYCRGDLPVFSSYLRYKIPISKMRLSHCDQIGIMADHIFPHMQDSVWLATTYLKP